MMLRLALTAAVASVALAGALPGALVAKIGAAKEAADRERGGG